MACRMSRKKVAAIICGLAVIVGACAVEWYLAVTRGQGFVLRLLPRDWFATRDLGAVARYCDRYAAEHNNARPEPALLVQNVPYVRVAEAQPYLGHGISVLESTESSENYLYSPYDKWRLGSRHPPRIYACNVARIRGPGGRYWVYSRDEEQDHHVVAGDLERGLCLWTGGTPVVPGCAFEGDPGKQVRLPMERSVVESLRLCYPNVQIPPDLTAGE